MRAHADALLKVSEKAKTTLLVLVALLFALLCKQDAATIVPNPERFEDVIEPPDLALAYPPAESAAVLARVEAGQEAPSTVFVYESRSGESRGSYLIPLKPEFRRGDKATVIGFVSEREGVRCGTSGVWCTSSASQLEELSMWHGGCCAWLGDGNGGSGHTALSPSFRSSGALSGRLPVKTRSPRYSTQTNFARFMLPAAGGKAG